MKFTLPTLLAAAVLAGLLHSPEPAFGQNKEIGVLQRDVYDLGRKIDELKTGQGERAAQTETLMKQLMDANAALTAELKALQETVRKNQTEQQTRVIEPLAAVKLGMEDASRDVSVLGTTLTSMAKRQETLERLLTDLKAGFALLQKTVEQAPAPAAVSAAPSTADAAAILFATAQGEKLEGKLNFAIATFGEIPTKYPESPFAPKAWYEVGLIYAQNEQYTDALQAFDRVLEQFGDNPMRKDAQFRKAEQLASLNRRADAVKEYSAFVRQYPGDDKTPIASSRAKDLAAPAPAPPKQKAKGKSK